MNISLHYKLSNRSSYIEGPVRCCSLSQVVFFFQTRTLSKSFNVVTYSVFCALSVYLLVGVSGSLSLDGIVDSDVLNCFDSSNLFVWTGGSISAIGMPLMSFFVAAKMLVIISVVFTFPLQVFALFPVHFCFSVIHFGDPFGYWQPHSGSFQHSCFLYLPIGPMFPPRLENSAMLNANSYFTRRFSLCL